MTLAEELLDELGVCQNCFIKLNEYDEFQTRANNIGSELLSMLNSRGVVDGEESESVNAVKIESLDYREDLIQAEGDEIGETITFDPYANEDEIFQDQDETEECYIDPSLLERNSNIQYEIIEATEDDKKAVKSQKKTTVTVNTSTESKRSNKIQARPRNSDDFEFAIRQVGDQKYFQCDICNKLCKDRSKLKTHREIHTSERNVVCPECGKCFKTANCLRNHRRLHVSERPKFDCDQCDKTYNQKVQLKKHIEVVHMQRRDVSSVDSKSRRIPIMPHLLFYVFHSSFAIPAVLHSEQIPS